MTLQLYSSGGVATATGSQSSVTPHVNLSLFSIFIKLFSEQKLAKIPYQISDMDKVFF